MQLIVLLLALMLGGKGGSMSELKPVLESLGGEELGNTIKQAEQLSGMLSAVQAFAGNRKQEGDNKGPDGDGNQSEGTGDASPQDGYPLSPIANIADEKITYCLSRYIALGE